MPVFPDAMTEALVRAHPSWQPVLQAGLAAVAEADRSYLEELAADHYLPTGSRMFAAFALPFDQVRYVLVGEGPYPREASATGVCFMDGAVEALWSAAGLSKQVNRATSLRNFMKMLLVAEGSLDPAHTTGEALAVVSARARAIGTPYIQTLGELQLNLSQHGFLLLNATLVYRAHVAPLRDARAWRPFLATVLEALARREGLAPTLVLWGKIAGQLAGIPAAGRLPQVAAEHPYNLSFIQNPTMQRLFGPMHLLRRPQ